MTGQVNALRAADIKASTISSNTRLEEKQTIMADLATGHPLTRLLYVTPEQCSAEGFRKRIKVVHEQGELARIAVDEAEWARLQDAAAQNPEVLQSIPLSLSLQYYNFKG